MSWTGLTSNNSTLYSRLRLGLIPALDTTKSTPTVGRTLLTPRLNGII
jgi:hypothetical protein